MSTLVDMLMCDKLFIYSFACATVACLNKYWCMWASTIFFNILTQNGWKHCYFYHWPSDSVFDNQRDQATSLEYNRKKEIPKIWRFGKGNFLADPTQIHWNYLQIYKNDTDLSFYIISILY